MATANPDPALAITSTKSERIETLTELLDEKCDQVDRAYTERNHLVAALSKLFPAGLEEDPEGDEDWRWVVFIDFPTGQATWHIPDWELGFFDHLARGTGRAWDGHSTDQKYARLDALEAGSAGFGSQPGSDAPALAIAERIARKLEFAWYEDEGTYGLAAPVSKTAPVIAAEIRPLVEALELVLCVADCSPTQMEQAILTMADAAEAALDAARERERKETK